MDMLAKAQRIVARHGTNDPETILRELGVPVVALEMRGLRGIYKVIENIPFVFIDGRLPERERQFVAGHELAHHLFHRGDNRIFLERRTLLKTSRQEAEANIFSLCLMAPDPDEVIAEGDDVRAVACRIGVSEGLAALYIAEVQRHRQKKDRPHVVL